MMDKELRDLYIQKAMIEQEISEYTKREDEKKAAHLAKYIGKAYMQTEDNGLVIYFMPLWIEPYSTMMGIYVEYDRYTQQYSVFRDAIYDTEMSFDDEIPVDTFKNIAREAIEKMMER